MFVFEVVSLIPTRFSESLPYSVGRARHRIGDVETRTHTLRVLIADDFEPIRKRLVEMLAEVPGVEIVGQSASVQETLAAIRTLTPDVVTLDLSMPDGNGLEVLRGTRDEMFRPIFIVLTNFSSPEYQTEANQHGAHAVLNKSREFGKAIDLISQLATKAAPGKGRNHHEQDATSVDIGKR